MRTLILKDAVFVSTLLCLATICIWIRSYWVCEGFAWYYLRTGPDIWTVGGPHIAWAHGRIRIGDEVYQLFDAPPAEDGAPCTGFHYHRYVHDVHTCWVSGKYLLLDHIGFALTTGRRYFSETLNFTVPWWFKLNITVPCWFMLVITSVLPAWYAVRVRRIRKQRALARLGRCIHCGYDLRASKNRCPECGTLFQSEVAHATG